MVRGGKRIKKMFLVKSLNLSNWEMQICACEMVGCTGTMDGVI